MVLRFSCYSVFPSPRTTFPTTYTQLNFPRHKKTLILPTFSPSNLMLKLSIFSRTTQNQNPAPIPIPLTQLYIQIFHNANGIVHKYKPLSDTEQKGG